LALWDQLADQFIKVMPKDYRRMLDAIQHAQQNGLAGEEAIMAAFEDNKNDMARISGN
jgi:glutamate synthase (ferredoxin)